MVCRDARQRPADPRLGLFTWSSGCERCCHGNWQLQRRSLGNRAHMAIREQLQKAPREKCSFPEKGMGTAWDQNRGGEERRRLSGVRGCILAER